MKRIELTPEAARMGGDMERALNQAAARRDSYLLPPVQPGDTFTVDGRRYEVTQVCGETTYLKPGTAPWDFAAPTRKVASALAFYRDTQPPGDRHHQEQHR